MNFTTRRTAAAMTAALLAGAWWSAGAQQPAAPAAPGDSLRSVSPAEIVPLPDVQTSGDARYVTGGIPYEQLPAFQEARSQYPLNVEIYEKAGQKNEFTSDVDVKLINAKSGEVVLDAKTDGPYLWAKVPPGQYKLQTTLNGKTRESRVAVNKGSHPTRAVVVFPQGTDD